MSVKMRTATAADVALMLDWAADEGWNPGLDDAAAFYAADSEGFFVAEADGQIVAAISVVNHSPEIAFLGLYLCRPDYRGKGIGFALWKHALAHAGERTVGLDGVAEQQANYAKSGFALAGSTTRYSGTLSASADPAVRPLAEGDAPALAELDRSANGFDRPAFLAGWLAPADSRWTVVLEEGGAPVGFATARLCREGVKIGPVIAPDSAAALRLVRAALVDAPQAQPVMLDLPQANAALAEALLSQGFAATFATARMYRGPAPFGDATLQVIATMELG